MNYNNLRFAVMQTNNIKFLYNLINLAYGYKRPKEVAIETLQDKCLEKII